MRQFLFATLLLLVFGIPTVFFLDGGEIVRGLRGAVDSISTVRSPSAALNDLTGRATLILRGMFGSSEPKKNDTVADLQRMAARRKLIPVAPATLDEIERMRQRAMGDTSPAIDSPFAVQVGPGESPPVTVSLLPDRSATRTANRIVPNAPTAPTVAMPASDYRSSGASTTSNAYAGGPEIVASVGSSSSSGDGSVASAALPRANHTPRNFDAEIPEIGEAANGGDASAALGLAARYVEGNGVERNYPLAYLWYEVAAEDAALSGDATDAIVWRNRVAAAMTAGELITATSLVGDWREQKRKGRATGRYPFTWWSPVWIVERTGPPASSADRPKD